ncbi:hypothetical protein ACIBQ1_57535 [Nonomuraea sp. NPDC050153]|uniref:hypothetical protein n=1 Tax=Nonomuraea sp. NPDC050153 TaxID=3364359 RepID=UPI0037B66A66
MPHGDDLDARFNELVAQIDEEQQRRMRAAAVKGAKEQRRTDRLERHAGRTARLSGGHESEPPRRVGRAWIAMAVITALIAAAGVIVTFRPDLLAPDAVVDDAPLSIAAPAVEPAVEPAEDPADEAAGEPTEGAGEEPTSPFAGSPAEKYAEGAAGFVMPEAKALGGLSKKDVAKGLKLTRELMSAAFLDKKTLLGGKPAAFIKLLDPEFREWYLDELKKRKKKAAYYVLQFARGTAEFSTDVIKVYGRVKLGTFKDHGRRGVELKLNHIVVYAVHRPGRPDTTIRLVTHPTGTVMLFRESGRLVVWPDGWTASRTPASCDTRDGFIHPEYEDSPQGTVAPTGAPIDPYELEEEDERTGCAASKGT